MNADEEIRTQRHDFIKEYYKMAVSDLDRHLKAGWQTIAVLAGGATVLAAGHEGKIGLPVATAIAIMSTFWGALTTVDANFWSLRAIGFLANVEAVYFSSEDRKNFNPYVGHHPSYKFLDSLRYMFWLCIFFGMACIACLIWEVSRFYPTLSVMWQKMVRLQAIPFILWSMPIIVTIGGCIWLYRVWIKRMADYLAFSEESPGPGVRVKHEDLRFVTLLPPEGQPTVATDDKSHEKLINDLKSSLTKWRKFSPYVTGSGVALTIIYILFVISKI